MTVNGTPGLHFLNCSVLGSPLTSNLQPWYIAAGVVTGLSCLLGIPANFTIIVQLSRHLRGSSMTQRLFFNLAVSDLLCLIYLPFGVFIFYNEICLANGLYQFLFYFFIFCTTTGLNILVLISIQRYYQVCNYRLYKGCSCLQIDYGAMVEVWANSVKRDSVTWPDIKLKCPFHLPGSPPRKVGQGAANMAADFTVLCVDARSPHGFPSRLPDTSPKRADIWFFLQCARH